MSLMGRVRRLYLGRESAVIEVDRTTLYLREGELFLDRADLGVAEILCAFDDGGSGAPGLRHRVAALARNLAGHRTRVRPWKPRGAIELVGPLPTVDLLMELTVHGCGERELLNRVGGPQAEFRTEPASPAMAQMASLEPEMAQVLATLAEPMTAQTIIRSVTLDRFGALQGLARLWAVGLVVHHEAEKPPPVPDAPTPRVRPRILERLRDSVLESLEAQPLKRGVTSHRERVAEFWRSHGDLDHYQVLGLDRGADTTPDVIHKGFAHLARQVHPSHAARLGLQDDDEMLKVLFERAVEAYWALSDTTRRIAYNRSLGAPAAQVDAQQRGAEKRDLARECYRQGTQLLAANDVSSAVDVLREAVRMDQQAAYYSLLGQAQSRNPAWTARAVQSFQQAVKLDPRDIRARMGLAVAYESQAREADALVQYRTVLEAMPDNAEARVALQRLGGEAPSSRVTGRIRGLFGGDANDAS